jgi:D-glycerate 3-kinase
VILEEWLLQQAEERIARGQRPVLGLNGPVGAGKSTLARQLQQRFAAAGLQLAVASIDDAYLPWPQRQAALAGNPFGVSRVPPGSHDPQALVAALAAWRAPASEGVLALPRFDKTLRGGEGDRIAPEAAPAQALLLEGWLLGCQPLAPAALEAALQLSLIHI